MDRPGIVERLRGLGIRTGDEAADFIEIVQAAAEQRFWQIVDQNGLTGLPSDMWGALDHLVRRDEADQARIADLEQQLAGAREAHNGSHSFEGWKGGDGRHYCKLNFATGAARTAFEDFHIQMAKERRDALES